MSKIVNKYVIITKDGYVRYEVLSAKVAEMAKKQNPDWVIVLVEKNMGA